MTRNHCASRALVEVLLVIVAIIITSWGAVLHAADPTTWQPSTTRVFIVSLAQFKGDRLHSFTTDDRLDDHFAAFFKERGVPASQILYLKDQQATTQNVRSEFTNFLRKSKPGEMLFFYFGSHGSYDHETGKYSFCAYDDNLSFTWALDAIERDFHGRHAFLATDCCFSGGIVDLVVKRETPIAYACLSSTYAHQTAWSGWRFMQCLMRGFAGHPVVDIDGDGHVGLDELASYTARYMAFAAEGKPMFKTTGDFPPQLRLASATKTKDPRVGELLEVRSGTKWARAEILEAKAPQYKIHFTKDTRSASDAWIGQQQVRPYLFSRFPAGFPVEVLNSSHETWHTAQVLENWESLHLCQLDGRSAAYNEWFGPSRIRASLAGTWAGQWKNDLKESGPDTLVLQQDKGDQLHGTWSGNVPMKVERLGKTVVLFEGTTPDRFYRGVGRIEGGRLEMDYCAHRNKGHYFGWAAFQRSGAVAVPGRGARVELAGNWKGTYENSRGGDGVETLDLAEDADQLRGTWSGVNVTGERLGNASFYLEGKLGQRTYHVVGHVAEGHLVLNYSATSSQERYFGWSTLENDNRQRF